MSSEYAELAPDEVRNYLESKSIEYKERGNELMFPCLNGCDDDDTETEKYHCSVNSKTGQWHCFKCEAKGNLPTLKKAFGDVAVKSSTRASSLTTTSMPTLKHLMRIAEKCHNSLMQPENKKLLDYLMKERGLSLFSINTNVLGVGEFYSKTWLTIPIIEDGECRLIKLRRLPDETDGAKYATFPSGSGSVVFGASNLLKKRSNQVLICGGEYDKIIAEQMKFPMPVITSTAGEGTFKDDWVDAFLNGLDKVFICFDNDEKGKTATLELANKITKRLENISVYQIPIPELLGDKADLTDVNLKKFTPEILLAQAKHIAGDEPISEESFPEISLAKLQEILGLTITHDNMNKVIVFLALLSAYTDHEQLNVFMNAQSASGKTYLAKEVAKLFPKNDVRIYARVTPKAFYYDTEFATEDEIGGHTLDLSRKILIFADQVDSQLQENLRPLLSHDDKKLPFKLTNRNHSGTNEAITGYMLGFPATVFCSANMRMDEQEQTRGLLISPEISQGKIASSIELTQERDGDPDAFELKLKNNAGRKSLMQRIRYIREQHIDNIVIPSELGVTKSFRESLGKTLSPRNQRDIQHLNSLIKVVTLLNTPTRERVSNSLIATKTDVDSAFEIWKYLNRSQQFGIPPQTLDHYVEIILPAFQSRTDLKVVGVTVKEVAAYYAKTTGQTLDQDRMRKQHLLVLEQAGLISYEKDPNDKRQRLIIPLVENITKKGDEE